MGKGEPLGSMFIELGLDASHFSPELTSAKRAVKFFQAEVKGLDNVLKGSGKNIGVLQTKYKSLENTIKAQKSVLQGLKKELDSVEKGSPKWEQKAVQIERENAKLAQMETQLQGVAKAMREISLQGTSLGKISTGLDKTGDILTNLGSKLRGIGDAMRPISTALSAGFTLATKKAIDFESQMTTTKSLLADTIPSASELNRVTAQLGDSSKSWAKEYGISTSSINEGMQELIKKGYDANQTMGAMPAILNAARASGEDFNTVANASTSILEQFNLKSNDTNQMIKNTSRVTDSLTYVANKTAAGFSDMATAMEYVGPVANSTGISLEETAAAIGLLSNNGIEGEKAGTALRGALTRLLKPSLENAKAMEQLGFSSDEFLSGALKFPDVLDRIKQSTEGMTDAQKAALIAQAFGTEAQTGMNILVNQGSDALRGLTKETENAAGYTSKLASEMNNSSKNGVERFKASLEVLQINIGQKLLPLFTPLVDGLNDFIDNLSKASPEVQQFWTMLGLGVAVAYPALNFVGNLASGLGSLLKVAGKTVGWANAKIGIKGIGVAAEETATALGGAEAAAVGASEGVGALTSSSGILGAILSPAGAVVLGTVAVAGGFALLSHAQDVAREKSEEFGTQVDNASRNELRNFKTVVDDTNTSMQAFTTVAGDASKVSDSFKKMYDDIAKSAQEANDKIQGLADKWGLTPEQVQKAQDYNNQIVSNSETMMNQINEIYQRHNGDASKFSAEEKEIILNNQNQMIEAKLQTMDLSAKQEKAIRVALNGDISQLNETQLKKSKESFEKMLEEEQKSYQTSKDELKELLDHKALTKSEYNQKMEQLESEHNNTMQTLGEKLFDVTQALDQKVKDRTGQSWNYWEEAKKKLESYGLSYEDIGKKAAEAAKNMGNSHSILAKYTSDMTQSTKEANDAWSVLVGNVNENGQLEVKSNVKEVIGEASKSVEGWEQLKIIAKEANLDSNARAVMAESLVEVGKWSELSVEDKKLIVDNKEGLQSIFDSKTELDIWNSMPDEVKQLLLDNDDVMSNAKSAREALENYNKLTPEQKKLVAEDKDVQDAVKRSTDSLTQWNVSAVDTKNLPVDEKQALASIGLGMDKMAAWNSTATPTKNLTGDATNVTNASNQGIGSLSLFNGYQIPTKPLTSDSTPTDNASAQAKASLGSFNTFGIDTRILPANETNAVNASNQAKSSFSSFNSHPLHTRQLNAQDNVSAVASQAKASIDSVPSHKTSILDMITNFFTHRHEKGTEYHQGGLAMVNDQKGSNYKELITLPTGEQFIPKGRNVILPLPVGSKVLNATKTRQLMQNLGIPKYQNGVGIPSDAKFLKDMERVQNIVKVDSSSSASNIDVEKIVSELGELKDTVASLLQALLNKDTSVYLDGDKIAQNTYQKQARIMAREGI